MSHKPATPNEGKWPPRLKVLFYNDGSYQIEGVKLLGGSKPYLSEEEHQALLAIERAKAFEEAALIVDKRETNGATAHILLRKAIEAREGK